MLREDAYGQIQQADVAGGRGHIVTVPSAGDEGWLGYEEDSTEIGGIYVPHTLAT